MNQAITLHIIRESSSLPGGTTVMSRICSKDCACMGPSPLAFILRVGDPVVTALRMMFFAATTSLLSKWKFERWKNEATHRSCFAQLYISPRDMVLEGNSVCLGFWNEKGVIMTFERSRTWLGQNFSYKKVNAILRKDLPATNTFVLIMYPPRIVRLDGLVAVAGTLCSRLSTKCSPWGTIADARKKNESIQARELLTGNKLL